MPSWCYNKLDVSGPTEKVEEFIAAACSDELVFDLNNFVPFPEDEPEENWYYWRIRNWGTKWNTSDGRVTKSATSDEGEGHIQLRFGTAWSPPLPVFLAASKMFPSLELKLYCEYEAEDKPTSITFKNGDSSDRKTVDIFTALMTLMSYPED